MKEMEEMEALLRRIAREEAEAALERRFGPAVSRLTDGAVDVAEACRLLGCARASLTRMRKAGQLRVVKLGSRGVRVPLAEIERVLGDPAPIAQEPAEITTIESLARARRRAAGGG